MKKWFIVCFAVIAVVACSKDKSSTPTKGAVTPLDTCAAQGGVGCQNYYGNGQQFYPNGYGYPTQGGYYAGYQGGNYGYSNLACPPGTQPVMNGGAGLGCIPLHSYQNLQFQGYHMQYQQLQVQGSYQQLPSSCQSNLHCSPGYYCQQSLGQGVGICVR